MENLRFTFYIPLGKYAELIDGCEWLVRILAKED
jgi:hypothetical protein